MESEAKDLHMLFFPFVAPGHMLPLVSMAKLFASAGARITILTIPVNVAIIRPTIDDSIHLHVIPFPSSDFDHPEGCESPKFAIPDDLRINFFKALSSLRRPFDSVLRDLNPDCIVTDMLLPWTYHVAAARGIPRLVFNGSSYFAFCVHHAFNQCCILTDEAESFILPGLPHQIEMLKTQVIDLNKLAGTPLESLLETLNEAMDVDQKSYGTVMNSFYELEHEYVDHCREVIGRRAWNVGPVLLYNQQMTYKLARGGDQPTLADECLKWLDGKPTGSVVYICFGSWGLSSVAQLREMALGLEASRHPFVWVVRNEGDDWVPEGFEESIKGRGMVIRGWAPQLLILNHDAVGGFMTHCGWNSSLEGMSAGLPMATWPLYAEQFYNEKLLVEVLKVGVAVGSKVCSMNPEERPVLEAATVEAAMRRVMGEGEEAKERRMRAKELREMARRAVEKGGSSYEEIRQLMQELIAHKKHV